MVRTSDVKYTPEVDALDGVPLPREQTQLFGHKDVERQLHEAYRSERFHHAWILAGPKGIGKATLAFRFARFVLRYPDRFGSEAAETRSLDTAMEDPVSRQVAAGAHPNVLHLRRPWDEKAKRFKADLPVDEVRKTVAFFGTTASGSAWRVCIVDAADDMNVSSANALLKVLEEPPPRCVFLVLSHAPGRLLPTIRSRCRKIDLLPLATEELSTGLKSLAPESIPQGAELSDLIGFADGSLRSALTLLSGDALAISKGFVALAQQAPDIDVAALHHLADLISARGQTDNWDTFVHISRQWLHGRMKQDSAKGLARLVSWTDLWEKMNRAVADADALNLDRKQVVIDMFRNLCLVMRMPA